MAILAPLGLTDWSAEVVADMGDTLEILAIEVLDEKGRPRKDVVLTALDSNGDPIVTFPNESPVPEPGQALLALAGGLVLWAARRRSGSAAARISGACGAVPRAPPRRQGGACAERSWRRHQG